MSFLVLDSVNQGTSKYLLAVSKEIVLDLTVELSSTKTATKVSHPLAATPHPSRLPASLATSVVVVVHSVNLVVQLAAL